MCQPVITQSTKTLGQVPALGQTRSAYALPAAWNTLNVLRVQVALEVVVAAAVAVKVAAEYQQHC